MCLYSCYIPFGAQIDIWLIYITKKYEGGAQMNIIKRSPVAQPTPTNGNCPNMVAGCK